MILKDKVAIVTGGGSGIGQATSLCLAKEGATLAVGDVVLDSAMETALEILRQEAGPYTGDWMSRMRPASTPLLTGFSMSTRRWISL